MSQLAAFCFFSRLTTKRHHKQKVNDMKTLKALSDEIKTCLADADALVKLAQSEDREFTDEESTRYDALVAKTDELTAKATKAQADEERIEAAKVKLAELSNPVRRASFGDPTNVPRNSDHFVEAKSVEFPKRRYGALRHMSHLKGATVAEQEETAYRFGIWMLAARGHDRARRWCAENGLPVLGATAHTEGNNFNGGYLVPEQFDNMMIDLREVYGVFRRNAKVVPMTSETYSTPRRTGGLTAYFVGEDSAITESNKSWDRVNLVAKDVYCISRYTNQLNDDAVINIGDDLAGEIAYAFAMKEDNCGFLGDGTSTYAGITGLKVKVTASTSGLITGASGTATSWSGITLANFNSMVGLLPQYADTPNTKWYCHKGFYGSVMQKLEYAAGGNSVNSIAGGTGRMFLGYPVEISQVLSSAAGSAEVVCYLGDLSMAALFGDRRGTSIAFSDSAVINSVSMFERNETAIRGWERFDIVVHDPFTTTVGPVVGLLTAS